MYKLNLFTKKLEKISEKVTDKSRSKSFNKFIELLHASSLSD